jgi:hypothetical protein
MQEQQANTADGRFERLNTSSYFVLFKQNRPARPGGRFWGTFPSWV